MDRNANNSSRPANNERTQIWELYSRLRLWAEESNANSLPEEQQSLDELLGSTHDVRKALFDIFIEMQNLLRMALDIADQNEDVDLESSIAGLSSSEGTMSSIPPNLESPTSKAETRMSKFALVISHITSKVGLLFQMSNVIRRLQPRQADLETAQSLEGPKLQLEQSEQEENVPSDQVHIKIEPGSSKEPAEAVKAGQSHFAQRLSHNKTNPKRLSNSMEERQRIMLHDWIGLWADTESTVSGEVPERLQINSLFIYQELQQITDIQFDVLILRMGPPYKLLIHHLTDIETRLKTLQQSREEMNAVHRSNRTQNPGKAPESNSTQAQRWPKHEASNLNVQMETTFTTIAHLECLLQFIRSDLAPLVELHEGIKNVTLTHITFDNIWHLIKPGELLVSNREEKIQLVRAYAVTGGQRRIRNRTVEEALPGQARGMITATPTPFQGNDDSDEEYAESRIDATSGVGTWAPLRVDSYIMCSNGQKIGPVEVPQKIKHFTGYKKITDLEVYPLSFHEDSVGLLQQMRDRGLRYIEALGHKNYEGLGQLLSEETRYEDIYGDVFVDPEAFYQANPSQRPRLGRLRKSRSDPSEATETIFNQMSSLVGDEVDSRLSEEYMASAQNRLTPIKIEDFDSGDVENVAMLPQVVVGYRFRARKWFLLGTDKMSNIDHKRGERAFDELVLPSSYKNIIISQVKNHSSQRHLQRRAIASQNVFSNQTGFVQGRAGGLVFLLHGPPGTGKTSTTEAVAAYSGRALYTITPRDVGTDAESVDKRLREHTDRAEKWGCILVIDEADIFLEQRSLNNITGNAIVTVLLRELEYYSGIMFMTTNRVGVIDEAFRSRIHFSLYYPSLDKDASIQIWQYLLRRIKRCNEYENPKIEFHENQLLEFATVMFDREPLARWNGRQIHNAFQTALVLARYEADQDDQHEIVHLDEKHFEVVAKTSAEFDSYLQKLYGREATVRAHENFWRFDPDD
ncbi:hypothetical protein G7054_g9402 [Neopestalotiopsis clavispora]|nr:hypothetical protein G7054_g9402 [Neopestalotiopsis clavispora]